MKRQDEMSSFKESRKIRYKGFQLRAYFHYFPLSQTRWNHDNGKVKKHKTLTHIRHFGSFWQSKVIEEIDKRII